MGRLLFIVSIYGKKSTEGIGSNSINHSCCQIRPKKMTGKYHASYKDFRTSEVEGYQAFCHRGVTYTEWRERKDQIQWLHGNEKDSPTRNGDI